MLNNIYKYCNIITVYYNFNLNGFDIGRTSGEGGSANIFLLDG